MAGITVAYSGVHQAYQIALAAVEAGVLDDFFCSLFVAPGKWGQRLAALLGEDVLVNRRCDGLPPERVREYPWPFLLHRLKLRLFGAAHEPWTTANPRFDHWAARQLKASSARIFVGSETCARDCFRVARERGMIRVLDAPQVQADFLISTLARAYEELGLPFSRRIDDDEIAQRKEEELRLADRILVYSEYHRRSFAEAGIPSDRMVKIPLWADPGLWDKPHEYSTQPSGRLRVLFVGSIGVRKGVPWLLQAATKLQNEISLKLVGPIEKGFDTFLARFTDSFEYLGRQSKSALADEYRRADILVLPSIADSFGFVGMEAMLAGVPVIASTHCGVPLPDERWRVPVMDSNAVVERLQTYVDDPTLVESHGGMAKQFARRFTPAAYRAKIGHLFRGLLDSATPLR